MFNYKSIILFFSLLNASVIAQNKQIDSIKYLLAKESSLEKKLQHCLNFSLFQANLSTQDENRYTLLALNYAKQLKTKESKALANAYNNRGVYFKHINQFDSAKLYLDSSIYVFNLINEPTTKPEQNYIGIYIKLKLYDEALLKAKKLYEKIIENKGEQDTSEELFAINNSLGIIYSRIQNYPKSLFYYRQNMFIAKKENDKLKEYTCLLNIGLVFKKSKNYDSAEVYYKQSLKLVQQFDVKLLKNVWLVLGTNYLNKNELDSAKKYLTQTKEVSKNEHDDYYFSEACSYLSDLYLIQGDSIKSMRELKEKESIEGKLDIVTHKANQLISNEKLAQMESQKKKIWNFKTGIILISSLLLIVSLFGVIRYKKVKKGLSFENDRILKDLAELQEEHLTLKEKFQKINTKIEKQPKEKYITSALNQEKRNELMLKILDYMQNEKPYLNTDFNHKHLASQIGITPNQLSEVLSSNFEVNFYKFINIYRVNEAKKRLEDSKNNLLTVEAIGYDSGFNSKSSFFRIFKEVEGVSPTQFKQKLMLTA